MFLGGASIHLWLSDPAAPTTRTTDDVDVISTVTTRAGYHSLGERLRARGFSEASDSTVICRWRHRASDLILDVMPQGEDILGFSNPWYQHAIATAADRQLPSGTQILAATPASIVATKLAAWKGRGKDDMLASLDLHDIVILLDGRAELPEEIAAEPSNLQTYVVRELSILRKDRYFPYLIESALHGYGQLATSRASYVQAQIDKLTSPQP